MSFAEILRMALGSLGVNKLRSFLTALGIIIGTGAVIAMVSIGEGAKARVAEAFASMGTNLLVVQSSSPWKSMKELIEHSRKNPGAINYTTSGAMGITHLLAEIFSKEAQLRWTHIPTQGSGPAITQLLGGHVNMSSTALAPALAHIKSGTLRPLAVFGDTRLRALPAGAQAPERKKPA